jgi:hypothetical protein
MTEAELEHQPEMAAEKELPDGAFPHCPTG